MADHIPHPPFFATAGSSAPKIVLVGEAWGESEDQLRKPFVGESGKELFRMLGEAFPDLEPELHQRISAMHKYGLAWVRDRDEWFSAAGIACTNVLSFRPTGNKLESLCGTKKEVSSSAGLYPPLSKGKYLHEQFLSELSRLESELSALRPNLIVALGNTATWALLRATNIGSIRGAITQCVEGGVGTGAKCLPTYHPAGVLRNWSWRPIVVADLMKARREGEFADIRRPNRQILVDPTLEEITAWVSTVLANPPEFLSPDIETANSQITCIGFAKSTGEAIVIPFWDKRKPGWNYWADRYYERMALDQVARLLESPIPKVGQNFIYDLQYITKYGIRPRACIADTMLLHHSLFPEMQKGLGFLGSIYTNEASWKLMRKRKADSEKKDE